MAHGLFNSEIFNNEIFNTHEAIEIAGTLATQQLTSKKKRKRPEQLITTEFTFRLISRTIPKLFYEVIDSIKNLNQFGVFSNELNNLLTAPILDLRNFVEKKIREEEKVIKNLKLAEKMSKLSNIELIKLLFRVRKNGK